MDMSGNKAQVVLKAAFLDTHDKIKRGVFCMSEQVNKPLEEALAYMCNLPKVYVEELELNKDIFLGILGHICDIAQDGGDDDSHTSTYMPLSYDVVQKYCSRGFPTKFVCSNHAQYCRTIDAAIYIYYKLLRSGEHELTDEECKKMFGSCFFDGHNLGELNEDAVVLCLKGEKLGRIEEAKQDGYWRKNFEENWRKKRGLLLSNQIEKGQIILDNLFCVDDFNKLADQGSTLKRVLNFLDKLESESHERSADNVLVPYKEYHALHELLLERPWEKVDLQEEHAKLVQKFMRIANFEARKKP